MRIDFSLRAVSMTTGRGLLGAGAGLVAAFVILHAAPLRAEPVAIVSFEIGAGIQTEDGDGFYGRALGQVLGEAGVEFSFSVIPLQRAIAAFQSRESDCIWAIDAATLASAGVVDEGIIESSSLFTSELHIFMPPGAAAVSDLHELEGRSIGVSIGSPVPEMLHGLAINYVRLRSQDIKVRMLSERRLDAIAGWTPDIWLVFHNNGLAPTAFNPALPIAKSEVGLVCWTTPATIAFLKSVNPRIEEFRKSGNLRDILREFSIQHN